MGQYAFAGRGLVPNIIMPLWGSMHLLGGGWYPISSCLYGAVCICWEGVGTQYHHAFMGQHAFAGRGLVPNIIMPLWGSMHLLGGGGYPISSCLYGAVCIC